MNQRINRRRFPGVTAPANRKVRRPAAELARA
jgi:hypothetical protein